MSKAVSKTAAKPAKKTTLSATKHRISPKGLRREIRLAIVSILISCIMKILPKDAWSYWDWLSKMPVD